MKHLLPLPADTPFGNLALKYVTIIQRLDYINVMVRMVYQSFERARTQNFSRDILNHALLSEQVIYWLRKTVDDLIGLHHVLAYREEAGCYPRRVAPDSIGRLLQQKDVPPLYTGHVPFLNTLNDIANAYKHSFVNSDLTLMGRDEPIVYALGLRQNDLSNEPTFHAIPLQQVVFQFDTFFTVMTAALRKCKIPHLSPRGDGSA